MDPMSKKVVQYPESNVDNKSAYFKNILSCAVADVLRHGSVTAAHVHTAHFQHTSMACGWIHDANASLAPGVRRVQVAAGRSHAQSAGRGREGMDQKKNN